MFPNTPTIEGARDSFVLFRSFWTQDHAKNSLEDLVQSGYLNHCLWDLNLLDYFQTKRDVNKRPYITSISSVYLDTTSHIITAYANFKAKKVAATRGHFLDKY